MTVVVTAISLIGGFCVELFFLDMLYIEIFMSYIYVVGMFDKCMCVFI